MWKLEVSLMCHSWGFHPPWFLRQDLPQAWNLSIGVDWLASKPHGSNHYCLPQPFQWWDYNYIPSLIFISTLILRVDLFQVLTSTWQVLHWLFQSRQPHLVFFYSSRVNSEAGHYFIWQHCSSLIFKQNKLFTMNNKILFSKFMPN